MTQLALLPTTRNAAFEAAAATGPWSDIGRWFAGDTDERPACLPTAVGTVRVLERPCGCRRTERRGAAWWVSMGSRTCPIHKSFPEEAP